jgi:hypothetical protein
VDQGIEISKTGTAFVSTSAWAGHARAENACTARITRISTAVHNALVSAFSTDFYIDEDAVRSAIKSQRKFDLMHLDSAIKVDLIVRKNSEYRHAEFERRKSVEFAGISTWITSREDLILSKLIWARDTGSEMQLRDVRTLIDESVDWLYLKDWAAKLGIAAKLDELSK